MKPWQFGNTSVRSATRSYLGYADTTILYLIGWLR